MSVLLTHPDCSHFVHTILKLLPLYVGMIAIESELFANRTLFRSTRSVHVHGLHENTDENRLVPQHHASELSEDQSETHITLCWVSGLGLQSWLGSIESSHVLNLGQYHRMATSLPKSQDI